MQQSILCGKGCQVGFWPALTGTSPKPYGKRVPGRKKFRQGGRAGRAGWSDRPRQGKGWRKRGKSTGRPGAKVSQGTGRGRQARSDSDRQPPARRADCPGKAPQNHLQRQAKAPANCADSCPRGGKGAPAGGKRGRAGGGFGQALTVLWEGLGRPRPRPRRPGVGGGVPPTPPWIPRPTPYDQRG
jgi:hypothetical protein